MVNLEKIKEAILLLVEQGFQVTNNRGGCFQKGDGLYFHRTCHHAYVYASEDKMEVFNRFLSESIEHVYSL